MCKELSDKINVLSTTKEEPKFIEESTVEELFLNGVLKSALIVTARSTNITNFLISLGESEVKRGRRKDHTSTERVVFNNEGKTVSEREETNNDGER